MSIPDVSKLQKMIKESYGDGKSVEDWELIKSTPTLKFYFKDGSLVIAIRGTADARDTKADALIAFGQLERSDRWKEDLAKVQEVIRLVEPSHVFGVGHSLGGAILDLFLKKGLIEKGVSYNPAVQPQDIRGTLNNRRIYMSGDPLYTLVGRLLYQKPEVRNSKTSLFTKLLQLSPAGNILTADSYLKNHSLDQFEGGVSPFQRELTRVIRLHRFTSGYRQALETLMNRYNVPLSKFLKEVKKAEKVLTTIPEETESDLEGGAKVKRQIVNQIKKIKKEFENFNMEWEDYTNAINRIKNKYKLSDEIMNSLEEVVELELYPTELNPIAEETGGRCHKCGKFRK